MGISGMMHGYLVFDKAGELLVPFRTWRNTITGQAAAELTEQFRFNIPQRWSIAHLYQAILNREKHVKDVALLTTLSGYIHLRLTGRNVVGVGEASGMFPMTGRAGTSPPPMWSGSTPWWRTGTFPGSCAISSPASCLPEPRRGC